MAPDWRPVISAERLAQLAIGKRWFGDKGRTIASATAMDVFDIDPSARIALAVVKYEFEWGAPSHYLVPIDLSNGEEATDTQAVLTWLRSTPSTHAADKGAIRFETLPGKHVPDPDEAPGKLLGVEQSNTSIRFGDRLLVKINRKLTPGISPEAELAAVIARAADSTFAPETYGSLVLYDVFPEPATLAIFAEFVPNDGDAWSEMLALVRAGQYDRALTAAGGIGETTARMHLGLLSDPWRSEVSPEPVSAATIATWESNARAEMDALIQTLGNLDQTSHGRAGRLLTLLPDVVPLLQQQLGGFPALARTYQTRIHGDYHLGQVLRARDDRYVIVDFDGEPHRTLDERRRKYAPLRDVAGMMRSFAYCRGTVEQEADLETPAELRAWESAARGAFLDRYISAARAAPMALIPEAPDDIRRALVALEIEKAVYECGYELNNRPDWLWLPLSRLVQTP